MLKQFIVLFSALMVGSLTLPQASVADVLVNNTKNSLYFNNFENLFDVNGQYKVGVPAQIGDHLVGIINVQNINADGKTHFYSGLQNQLTGIFAQRIEKILSPDTYGGPEPHFVLGPPSLTHFCRGTDCFDLPTLPAGQGWTDGGNVMLAVYLQTGGGTTVFESNGSMADDVAKATDGNLWMALGYDEGANGFDSGDEDGYWYSHTDGAFPPPDKSYAGLNAVINNSGFEYMYINDVNEAEIGDDAYGFPLIFNTMVMTSEFEFNSDGTIFGGGSPWELASNDPATLWPMDLPEGACRFTGGGVDTFNQDGLEFLTWNGGLEDGASGENRYQFGGQAGANTGQQPQPKGEWTHHQQRGPFGSFTFHGGTASAPQGTEIDAIRCSDEGACLPARKAPTKQLDFDGIGTFKNIGKGQNAPQWLIGKPLLNVTAEGNGNKTFDGTFHWFEVNVDDLGEPGNENSSKNLDPAAYPDICPADGFGEKAVTQLADCSCPDFYRITIYNGVKAKDVVKNPDGSIDPTSLDHTNVIYQVWGYIDGGNLQIHPPTGFDLK